MANLNMTECLEIQIHNEFKNEKQVQKSEKNDARVQERGTSQREQEGADSQESFPSHCNRSI